MDTALGLDEARARALEYATAPWYKRGRSVDWKSVAKGALVALVAVLLVAGFAAAAFAQTIYIAEIRYISTGSVLKRYYFDDTMDADDILYTDSSFTGTSDYSLNALAELYDGSTTYEVYVVNMSTDTEVTLSSYLAGNVPDEDDETTADESVADVEIETDWVDEILSQMDITEQPVCYVAMIFVGSVVNGCTQLVWAITQGMEEVLANITSYGNLDGSLDYSYYSGAAGGSTSESALLNAASATLYDIAYDIANTVVEPVAIVILSMVLLFQLTKISTRFGQPGLMPEAREVIVLCVMAALYMWFVSHAFELVCATFEVFQSLVSAAMSLSIDDLTLSIFESESAVESAFEVDASSLIGTSGEYSLGLIMQLAVTAIICVVLYVWIFVRFVSFAIQAFGASISRAIEIYLLAAFAPLPFSFIGLDETRGWAIGYLKNFMTVCLQGALIYLVIASFPLVIATVAGDYTFSLSGGFTTLIVYVIQVVAVTKIYNKLLTNTGQLTQMVLGS